MVDLSSSEGARNGNTLRICIGAVLIPFFAFDFCSCCRCRTAASKTVEEAAGRPGVAASWFGGCAIRAGRFAYTQRAVQCRQVLIGASLLSCGSVTN